MIDRPTSDTWVIIYELPECEGSILVAYGRWWSSCDGRYRRDGSDRGRIRLRSGSGRISRWGIVGGVGRISIRYRNRPDHSIWWR